MSTIIFNPRALQGLYNGERGSLMYANINDSDIADSACFGSGSATASNQFVPAIFFVFQGTPPTNFDAFTSISDRQSDLLMALPIRWPEVITYTNPTGLRFRVCGTVGSTLVKTGMTANVAGNVLTGTFTTSHGFIPGQKIKLTNANPNTSANLNNVTFVIDSTPTSLTWTANAANGEFDGTQVVASGNSLSVTSTVNSVAQKSGTATWFVAANWTASNTISTPFTNYGAAIGNISLPGLGGDLQIPNTQLVEGTYYSSTGFFINFPFTWNI